MWWTYSYSPVPDDDGRVGGVLVTCQETTAHVRAAAALRASEARVRDQLTELAAVYHAAPVGMAVFDRDLRWVRINERLAEINGFPADTHIGRAVRDLLPDVADTAEATLRHILETGEPLRDVEFRGTTPAQPGVERVWVEQWLPLRDASGAVAGVHVVAEEVTERRRMEAERERLLAAEREARARAETEARRSATLQALAVELAAADTPEAVARRALAAGREVPGITRGSLFLVADGDAPRDTLALVGAAGYDPALLAGWRRVPNTPDTPGGDVVARGEPVILGRRDELARRYPAMRGLLDAGAYAGGAVYPLLTHGAADDAPEGHDADAGAPRGPARVAGILGFDFDAERDLDDADARFLAALADLAGQALDRVRLFEAERAARAAAEGERRRLAAVLEHLPVGVTFAEAPDGRHSLSNPAAVEIWGVVPASPNVETYSREFIGFWVGDGPEAARRVASDAWPLARALQRGEVVRDAVVEIERPDGTRRVVSLSAAPVHDAAGAITGALVTSTDVTEREALLGRVREQEGQLAAVFAQLPAAVWLTDAQGRVLRTSAAAAAIFGGAPHVTSPEEYGVYEAYWPAGHPRAGARLAGDEWTLARTLRTGAPVTGERLEIVRFDTGERRQVLNSTAPLRDATGHLVGGLAVMIDVTEREALLRALDAERDRATAARRAAEEANRAKSEFLASMSHELRTPLNAIGGHVQLVELGLHGPVTPAQADALGRIQRAQRHLLGLINDVLNYAKLEAGRVEYDLRAVDAADVVADVLAMVEPQAAAKGLTLAGLSLAEDAGPAGDAAPPGRLAVWADREKLAQVLLNLLANAVKFTPAGGRVAVTLESPPAADGGAPDGGSDRVALRVALRVRDTGVGIPADRLADIFEPFVQVRPRGAAGHAGRQDGTGLGLAISRDLARGMGADLGVESAEGAGSTFTVWLRRAAGPPPNQRPTTA